MVQKGMVKAIPFLYICITKTKNIMTEQLNKKNFTAFEIDKESFQPIREIDISSVAVDNIKGVITVTLKNETQCLGLDIKNTICNGNR